MGLEDFFKSKNSGGATGSLTPYSLTILGKEKAETHTASNPYTEVMAYLNETSSACIKEISREVKISPEKTKIIIRDMIRQGYVQKANPSR